MLKDVAQQLKQCNKDIEKLPREVANEPYLSVLNVVSAFCGKVAEHVYGSPAYPALVQENNQTYEDFRLTIALTQPAFVPCESFMTPAFNISAFLPSDDVRQSTKPVYLDDVRTHATGYAMSVIFFCRLLISIQIYHARAPAQHSVRREGVPYQSLSRDMGRLCSGVFRERPESISRHTYCHDRPALRAV